MLHFRWICIYPAYINSKKTIAEGRRISKDKSVENPTIPEIMEVLSTSGLKALPENKQYSRERSREFNVRGRVRVQIKNDDGTPSNPEYPSSKFHFIHFICFSLETLLIFRRICRRERYDIHRYKYSQTEITYYQ